MYRLTTTYTDSILEYNALWSSTFIYFFKLSSLYDYMIVGAKAAHNATEIEDTARTV